MFFPFLCPSIQIAFTGLGFLMLLIYTPKKGMIPEDTFPNMPIEMPDGSCHGSPPAALAVYRANSLGESRQHKTLGSAGAPEPRHPSGRTLYISFIEIKALKSSDLFLSANLVHLPGS
jgi:hypothetical protein